MKKIYETYLLLKESRCDVAGEHRLFLGLTGDCKPAACINCGDWTDNSKSIPEELYENI